MRQHRDEMIFASAKTEPLAFSFAQARRFLRYGGMDLPWREMTVLSNLRDAFGFLAANWRYPVELGTLLEYNALIGANDLEANAGCIRGDYPVRISGTSHVPPGIDAAEAKRVIDGSRERYADPVERALYLSLEIPRRQFCCDGNKRTGLMVANHILAHHDAGCALIPATGKGDDVLFDNSYTDLLLSFYSGTIGEPEAIGYARKFLKRCPVA